MKAAAAVTWHPNAPKPLALVLGTNEIASAVAARLNHARFAIVLCHDAFPPVIRRGMAFHDVLYGDTRDIDGVIGCRADNIAEVVRIHCEPGHVAVTEMHLTDIIAFRYPAVIIDARMQKHLVTPDLRGVAGIAVGIGPRFAAGQNCDVAIETHPCETGAIVAQGTTRNADGKARDLGGAGRERFVYSDQEAVWHTPLDIGTRVYKGLQLGSLGGMAVLAPLDGALRGIARDGVRVPANVKLLEIDPRGRSAAWTGMDERGQAIAASVVSAVHNIMQTGRKAGRVSANV
ncbi:xanthine dehydrogenase [Bradyrhizobium ontarionense]|uniref:Xanthine dehydrogenase n=1 Tax=Bradyrhizobium ontarionense TaxID=2898149 RepID=A0ABY3RJP0_9BRAD|nr:xanthine dehydrogenase [Bradyrhizobium sp. A19]UFZ07581.1 xanthine dehydrogenase [Bradyrhizobium sp. A19]